MHVKEKYGVFKAHSPHENCQIYIYREREKKKKLTGVEVCHGREQARDLFNEQVINVTTKKLNQGCILYYFRLDR
jgi:hypothetical protein